MNESLLCRCCTFDNRGIGSSSIPEHLSAYKTGIMAADVRALMDHLGWRKAHVMGMSLGGKPPQPHATPVVGSLHHSTVSSIQDRYHGRGCEGANGLPGLAQGACHGHVSRR